MPQFGYGCAVFMQSDIVDFQRQGWTAGRDHGRAGSVLPKNIWLYVSQIPNLAALGTRFVLQGGTQHNLAAVKAQVDFIESRFKGKDVTADVIVHEHCGEAGAIGAALEAGPPLGERPRDARSSAWRPCATSRYSTHRDEDTRCYFCKNKCLRTFIDVKTVAGARRSTTAARRSRRSRSKPGAQRLIIGNRARRAPSKTSTTCAEIKKGTSTPIKKANPNFVEIAAEAVFRSVRARRNGRGPAAPSWRSPTAQKSAQRAAGEARRRSASASRAC